jgi:hypothetical protein
MGAIIGFLLRNGSGLIKDGAEILIGQAVIRAVTQRLKGILIFYAVISVFALAALIFLYVLVYRWLSLQLDDVSAAAILVGANLLMIVVMLAGKAVSKPKPVPTGAAAPLIEMVRSQVGHLGAEAKAGNFEAGMAMGQEIGARLRKATPQIALAAAVIGLVIGIRPQILGQFGRRQQQPRKG